VIVVVAPPGDYPMLRQGIGSREGGPRQKYRGRAPGREGDPIGRPALVQPGKLPHSEPSESKGQEQQQRHEQAAKQG
jgi:hypothetical protein